MSVSGILNEHGPFASTACMVVGALILSAAVIRRGGARPQSALLLLGASNIAFWVSFGLWQLRLANARPSANGGIDPFAGVLAEWVIFLLLFSLYEVGVCIWGIFSIGRRAAAAAGLMATLLQAGTSILIAYRLVQGV
jgi:hypothetical protein